MNEIKLQRFDVNPKMIELKSTEYYVVMWMPKLKLDAFQGQFIKGHYQKCRVLAGSHKSKELVKKYIADNREDLKDFYQASLIHKMRGDKSLLVKSDKLGNIERLPIITPVNEDIKLEVRYYVVFSYESPLGLNIRKTTLTLNLDSKIEYTIEHLMNIMAKIIINGLTADNISFTNLVIINFIKL